MLNTVHDFAGTARCRKCGIGSNKSHTPCNVTKATLDDVEQTIAGLIARAELNTPGLLSTEDYEKFPIFRNAFEMAAHDIVAMLRERLGKMPIYAPDEGEAARRDGGMWYSRRQVLELIGEVDV